MDETALHPKGIEAVSKLSAVQRYEYFIRKVADFYEVWGLFGEGWAIAEDETGNALMPFWPQKEFAESCAIDEWKHDAATQIPLDDFLRVWLPSMRAKNIKPSIFWNNKDAVVLEIDALLVDLENELENYE